MGPESEPDLVPVETIGARREVDRWTLRLQDLHGVATGVTESVQNYKTGQQRAQSTRTARAEALKAAEAEAARKAREPEPAPAMEAALAPAFIPRPATRPKAPSRWRRAGAALWRALTWPFRAIKRLWQRLRRVFSRSDHA